jgi:flagellar assembly protein FliH
VSAYGPFELAPLEAVPVPAALAAGAPDADLETIRAVAFDEGFAAAQAAAQAQLEGPASALAAAAQQLQNLRADAAASVEAEAVELALRIAEQAIAATVTVRPEVVVDVVRGALRRLVERDRVTILVNPEDLELVRAASETLIAELGGIEHCDVQAERRVGRGGAVVRTVEGEVDATLATKLSRAREVLEDELRGTTDA